MIGSGLLLASALAPFFVNSSAQVGTSYISLGSIIEDRPMSMLYLRAGVDADAFGRFSIHHWDVSSLTDRCGDIHRRPFYHTEQGPAWDHLWEVAEGWKIKSNLIWAWTLYRGFHEPYSDGTYQWIHVDESLENDYLVPFVAFRRCYVQANYFYFKAGLRRLCALGHGFSLTPSVFVEGGNGKNYTRCFGKRSDGGSWGAGGVSSLTFRLTLAYYVGGGFSVYASADQYEVVGSEARETNAARGFCCAHNDWTVGTVGVHASF